MAGQGRDSRLPFQKRCLSLFSFFIWLPSNIFSAWLTRDIAGMVAAMTEGDPGVESERTSYNIPG